MLTIYTKYILVKYDSVSKYVGGLEGGVGENEVGCAIILRLARDAGDRTAHEHHRTRQAICPIIAAVGRAGGVGMAALCALRQHAHL